MQEPGEACDRDDLGGQTCQDLGFTAGDLACSPGCELDPSGCTGCGDGVCAADESLADCPADCGARAVVAGMAFSCALHGEGVVYCWGHNLDGQLGNGTTQNSDVPVLVTDISDAIAVSANGGGHTCTLSQADEVHCWGLGYLGDGTMGNTVPVLVPGLSGTAAVTAGATTTCVLLVDGTIQCWGSGGRVGDGTSQEAKTPVAIQSLHQPVQEVSAGGSHSCAALVNGEAWCWGDNTGGCLGDGTDEDRLFPVRVSGLSNVQSIVAGWSQSCAILDDGTAWCWGSGREGQLGDGEGQTSFIPVQVAGLDDVVQIAAGHFHTCAIRADRTAWCWGADDSTGYGGELGHGEATPSWTPVQVEGLTGVTTIAAGQQHSCASLEDGTLWCWGNNRYGQLGNGSTVEQSYAPVQVTWPDG